MFTIFIVIQILLTIALVGLVLVQRSDTDGLGSMGGGGGGNAFMTGRGTANFMTRSTAVVATLFIVNSLFLAIMSSNSRDSASLAERIVEDETAVSVPLADEAAKKPAEEPAATAPKPLEPEMPTTPRPQDPPLTTEEGAAEAKEAEPAPAPAEPVQDVPAAESGEGEVKPSVPTL